MNRTASRSRTWLRRLGVGLPAAVLSPWILFHLLSWCFPFPPAALDEARRAREAVRVLDREGHLLRAFPGAGDTWMFWADLDDVSPRLLEATIAAEDGRFWSHPGVDPLAAARAAWCNLTRGRTVSGASTVTMQVIRLLDDRPRTLRSKIVESFRALQLEGRLDKRRILEGYVNLAPYGGNLVGVEAAARAYFGKGAKDLTLGEAALLAGLPQAPSRLRPDRHPDRARVRRDWVLGRMAAHGFIGPEELAVARREPVPALRRPFPLEAPHAAELARRRHPGEPVLRTTLDSRLQALAESALREGVARLRAAGVTNGSVVVIDNEAAAVRALAGSCDFRSVPDRGQVNGATARRSPGSALKPFTYALAFERGVCTPATVLPDVPAVFGTYEPENFDHTHRGPVTAREALAASLNIPAVRLLRQVGTASLHAFLRDLGFSTLPPDPARCGLTLTLGSAEVTLLELTDAYAALARQGVYRPARLLETEPAAPGRRVLSEGAAYLVADVLADTDRLGGRPLWKTAPGQVRMAWKTGTSYGLRDAWTVAYTPRLTVGVWVGNFDGRPSRDLVGITAAAPIAARILDQAASADGGFPADWYATPASVERRPVCAVSGLPPGPLCETRGRDLQIRDRAPRDPCSVHRRVRVDAASGTRLCAACAAGHACTERVVECWPTDVAAWLRLTQPGRPLMPSHLATCARAAAEDAPPRILAPAAGQSYVLEAADGAASRRLMLKAAARGGRLYWFVDGVFVAATAPLQPAFWPLAPGPHTVVCADEAGRSVETAFTVH